MKEPETSRFVTDPNLVGGGDQPTWVKGRNCVYHDGSVAEYRVSIKASSGWKSYGHFSDLEVAAYVANIAILAEGCEDQYELNEIKGPKDANELSRWRRRLGNAERESLARTRFREIKAKRDAMLEEARQLSEKAAEEARQRTERSADEARKRAEERDKTINMIRAFSNEALVAFIKRTGKFNPFYDVAMNEAKRRYTLLGLPRET